MEDQSAIASLAIRLDVLALGTETAGQIRSRLAAERRQAEAEGGEKARRVAAEKKAAKVEARRLTAAKKAADIEEKKMRQDAQRAELIESQARKEVHKCAEDADVVEEASRKENAPLFVLFSLQINTAGFPEQQLLMGHESDYRRPRGGPQPGAGAKKNETTASRKATASAVKDAKKAMKLERIAKAASKREKAAHEVREKD